MCSDSVYIVFTKAKTLGWISRFLHPDISHCFAIWQDNGQWLKYDVSVDDVGICTVSDLSDIIDEMYVIKTEKQSTEGSVFGFNTCVGSVKRYIGLRDKFIFTPYQLFKRLNHGSL